MASLGTLAVNIVARTEKFAKGIGRAGSLTDKFSRRIAKASSLVGRFGGLAAGAAGVGGIGALTTALSRSADEIDRIGKAGKRLGIATDQLMGLRYAAAQTAGMADGQFDTALQRMTRRIAEAAIGAGEARGALRELGLDAARLMNLPLQERFYEIADRMSGVANQADRLRLAVKLFDTEGAALATTLEGGSGAVRKYVRELKGFGATFTPEQAAKVEAYNDAVDRLKRLLGGQMMGLTISVAPKAESAVNALTEAIKGFRLIAADMKKEPGWVSKFYNNVKNAPGNRNAKWLYDKGIYDPIYSRLAKRGSGPTDAASPERLAQLLRDGRMSDAAFAQSRNAKAVEALSDMAGVFDGPIGKQLSKDPAQRWANQFGSTVAAAIGAGFNSVVGDAKKLGGKSLERYRNLRGGLHSDDPFTEKLGGSIGGRRGVLALERAGSVASYMQRHRTLNQALEFGSRDAAIAAKGRRNPAVELHKKQLAETKKGNALLQEIAKGGPRLLPANIGGP